MKSPALIKLMHLVSPALPVGAYAYSQGQEYAVDSGWLKNQQDVEDWISGVMINSFGRLDVPCLLRFFRTWQTEDLDQVKYWNDYLIACRETSELLLEDQQLGQALQRLLESLAFSQAHTRVASAPCFANMFALAGVKWVIPERELTYGFIWSWLENQVAAATKIVPLGQTQAQQTLCRMMDAIEQTIELAYSLPDDDIGSGLPALAIASARHERQYSRLFRS